MITNNLNPHPDPNPDPISFPQERVLQLDYLADTDPNPNSNL